MAFSVRFTRSAQKDLRAIRAYIATSDCEANADYVARQILQAASTLQELPYRGAFLYLPKTSEKTAYRQIFFKPYRILYRIRGNTVFVGMVVDGRRNIGQCGREAMFEYAVRSSAAIPEAKLISIYGCVADIALTAVDLILDKEISLSTALGGASTVVGCVMLTPGIGELAEEGNKIVKSAEWAAKAAGWGSCALDAEDFMNALNDVLTGSPNADDIGKSIEDLGGCVGDLLGDMLKKE
jgi:toxin ParE1/3/4